MKMECECLICGWKFTAMNRIAVIKKAIHVKDTGHYVLAKETLTCVCGEKIFIEKPYNNCKCGMVYDLSGKSSGISFEWGETGKHLPEIFLHNAYN